MSKKKDEHLGGEYYLRYPIQPAKFAEVNKLSPMEYCVVKRMCRWRRGGKGLEDLLKAKGEIDILIALVEKGDLKITTAA